MVYPTENGSEKAYTEFWQDNLQRLEEITRDIELLLRELEREFRRIDPIFQKLENKTALLSSIQANFNSIGGQEYVMKLSAVLKEYRKTCSSEGVDFGLMDFLLAKISQGRSESLELFPSLRHDTGDRNTGDAKPETSPYKWISFRAGGSWFLAGFARLEIAALAQCSEYKRTDKDEFTVVFHGKKYSGIYYFSSFEEKPRAPEYFLIIDGGRLVFGADACGKRLYSGKNLMAGLISPLESAPVNSLIKGRVRLFGRNHLYIAP